MTDAISIEDEIRETLKGIEDKEPTEEPIIDDENEEKEEIKTEKVVLDDKEEEKDSKEIEKAPTKDEKGEISKEKEKEVETPIEAVEPPPQSLSGKIKQKWNDLDPEVRQELIKREEDFHRKLTAPDSEYHFGKKMKDVVSPYMAIIQSEGGTPEGAVKDLLNTAYVLRTGQPAQKAQLLMQVAQQYGVDLQQAQQSQEPVHPALAQMQQELQMLRQQANPDLIKQQLQEEMESASIQEQVNSFAGDPANKYFEQVKPIMASLLSSGAAQDIQEAYDKACYADPQIRSTLLAEQNKAQEAKRKEEVAKKKQASASVIGSPDGTSPNAKAPIKSLEDDLAEQMRAMQGQI